MNELHTYISINNRSKICAKVKFWCWVQKRGSCTLRLLLPPKRDHSSNIFLHSPSCICWLTGSDWELTSGAVCDLVACIMHRSLFNLYLRCSNDHPSLVSQPCRRPWHISELFSQFSLKSEKTYAERRLSTSSCHRKGLIFLWLLTYRTEIFHHEPRFEFSQVKNGGCKRKRERETTYRLFAELFWCI